MQRRALLAGLGTVGAVGVAGCTGPLSFFSRDDRHPVDLTLVDSDEIQADVGVKIDVELLEATITDSQPGRIEITTTNTADSTRAIDISQGSDCSLFNREDRESDSPPGIWIQHTESATKTDRTEDRWVTDAPYASPDYGCPLVEYESGESVTNEYLVLDELDTSEYFEPDEYRWEEPFSVARPQSAYDEATDVSWGFTLRVE